MDIFWNILGTPFGGIVMIAIVALTIGGLYDSRRRGDY